MKSSGPDTAVCLEKQVAGPMASGRGEGGPGWKAGLLPSSCWRGCGSHGVELEIQISRELSSDVNTLARSWNRSDDLQAADPTHLARAWAGTGSDGRRTRCIT